MSPETMKSDYDFDAKDRREIFYDRLSDEGLQGKINELTPEVAKLETLKAQLEKALAEQERRGQK